MSLTRLCHLQTLRRVDFHDKSRVQRINMYVQRDQNSTYRYSRFFVALYLFWYLYFSLSGDISFRRILSLIFFINIAFIKERSVFEILDEVEASSFRSMNDFRNIILLYFCDIKQYDVWCIIALFFVIIILHYFIIHHIILLRLYVCMFVPFNVFQNWQSNF